MGDISSEARDLASRLATGVLESLMTGNRADPERDIAAAIQRHMDATSEAEALALLRDVDVGTQKQRAEKAEATIDDLSRELSEEIEAHRVTRVRAESAEQRLADLVREVREWSPRYSTEVEPERWREFDAILAKYEQPAEVQP